MLKSGGKTMLTIDAKCTMCGASLVVVELESIVSCEYCQTTNILQNSIDFAKADPLEIAQIQRLRENLDEFVKQNSIEEILRVSALIKDLIPQDFLANYFFAYAKQAFAEESHLFQFLKTPPSFTDEELSLVVNHIAERGPINDKPAFSAFIKKHKPEYLHLYLATHSERVIKEQDYLIYQRDVFVCFSKYDYSLARNLVNELEDQGYSCWISKRNLKPGLPDKGRSQLEDAIANCDIFLYLSSEHSVIDLVLSEQLEYALDEGKRIIISEIDQTIPHQLLKSAASQGIRVPSYDSKRIIEAINQQKSIITKLNSPEQNIIPNEGPKREWTEVDLKNATQEFLSLFEYVVLNQRTNNDVIEFMYYMTGIRKVSELSPRKRKVFADLYQSLSEVYKNKYSYSDHMLQRFVRYSNKRYGSKNNKLTTSQLKRLIDSMSRRFK